MHFASVALINRGGSFVFKPPRLERVRDLTQARKAASRHWAKTTAIPDKLQRIFIVSIEGRSVAVSERTNGHRSWRESRIAANEAMRTPHLAAALQELGHTGTPVDGLPPAILNINGWIYIRQEPEEM